MSGIAGVFRRDGAPVDRSLLERMARSMDYRGRDGTAFWLDGPIGLVQLTTTPEPATKASRTSVARTERFVAGFSGHIDNPEELESQLAEPPSGATSSDAALLLRAFAAWGDATAERIVGPFAFAVWDRQRRRLWCARDFRGARPLYYHLTDRLFVFASDYPALFQEPSLSRRPNEGVVAEFLVRALTTREETFFQDVKRLVPGHRLAVDEHTFSTAAHWQPPTQLLTFSSDREAAEQLRDVLTVATRSCLRHHSRAAVQLSGGLDSGSVLMLARELAPPGSVEAASLVFPGLEDCDETPYIDALTTASRGPSLRIPFRPAGLEALFQSAEATLDIPDSPNGTMHGPLLAELRARGHGLLLNGEDGDAWLTGSAYQLCDSLRGFDLKALWPFLTSPSGTVRTRLGRLSRYGLGPLFPDGARRRLKRFLLPMEERQPAVPHWVDPAFSERTALKERLQHRPPVPPFSTRAQGQMHQGGFTAWQDAYADIIERTAERYGLETRSPFSDRRVVELAFALPDRLRWRGGRTKLILRQAMHDALPRLVRDRPDKAGYASVFAEEYIRPEYEELAQTSEAERRGWIRPGAAARQLQALVEPYRRADPRYQGHIWGAYVLIALEVWLSAVVRE